MSHQLPVNLPTFEVALSDIRRCSRCSAKIIWLSSKKTGNRYPTDVFEQNGAQVSRRNQFHRCDPQAVASVERQRLEKAGQLNLLEKPARYTPKGTCYGPEHGVLPCRHIEGPCQECLTCDPKYLRPKSRAEAQRAMKEYVQNATVKQLQGALTVIFNRQTESEQISETTSMDNGIGFTGTDAEILSDIYKQVKKYGVLRGGQVALVRRKMGKYSRQLVEAVEKGEFIP